MAVGGKNYRYNLDRLAYQFNGGMAIEYLENQNVKRINEIMEHTAKIAKEVKDSSNG